MIVYENELFAKKKELAFVGGLVYFKRYAFLKILILDKIKTES